MDTTLSRLTRTTDDLLAKVGQRFDEELRSDLPCVAALTRHVSRFRGKMLRPMLVILAGKAVGEVTDAHVTIATVVEMVHMATLVHDDVLDEAELRRRGATLNHLKGNEAAVLLGDFLISHSYHLCSSLGDQFAARTIAATTNRVCEGELLQLDNRGNVDLGEETYTQIVSRKTAALIATSAMLGAHYAGASKETVARLERFGECIGIAFQIQDDVLDLVGDVREVGKSLGSDVAKVKLTLPLIHFLRTAPQDHRLLLRQLLKSTESDRSEKVRHLITPSGSIDYARRRAAEYVDEAIACLAGLPDSDAKAALTEAANFVVVRSL
jgi:octaprenyl-diphosphate synthase